MPVYEELRSKVLQVLKENKAPEKADQSVAAAEDMGFSEEEQGFIEQQLKAYPKEKLFAQIGQFLLSAAFLALANRGDLLKRVLVHTSNTNAPAKQLRALLKKSFDKAPLLLHLRIGLRVDRKMPDGFYEAPEDHQTLIREAVIKLRAKQFNTYAWPGLVLLAKQFDMPAQPQDFVVLPKARPERSLRKRWRDLNEKTRFWLHPLVASLINSGTQSANICIGKPLLHLSQTTPYQVSVEGTIRLDKFPTLKSYIDYLLSGVLEFDLFGSEIFTDTSQLIFCLLMPYQFVFENKDGTPVLLSFYDILEGLFTKLNQHVEYDETLQFTIGYFHYLFDGIEEAAQQFASPEKKRGPAPILAGCRLFNHSGLPNFTNHELGEFIEKMIRQLSAKEEPEGSSTWHACLLLLHDMHQCHYPEPNTRENIGVLYLLKEELRKPHNATSSRAKAILTSVTLHLTALFDHKKRLGDEAKLQLKVEAFRYLNRHATFAKFHPSCSELMQSWMKDYSQPMQPKESEQQQAQATDGPATVPAASCAM